jgi:hypothetical protein
MTRDHELVCKLIVVGSILLFVTTIQAAENWQFSQSIAEMQYENGIPVAHNSSLCLEPGALKIVIGVEGGATSALIQSKTSASSFLFSAGEQDLPSGSEGCYDHSVGNWSSLKTDQTPRTKITYMSKVAEKPPEQAQCTSEKACEGWQRCDSGKCKNPSCSSTASWLALDVNGDGKKDLLQLFRGGATTLLSDGQKFKRAGTVSTQGSGCLPLIMDVDGDSKQDLVLRCRAAAGNAEAIVLKSNGTTFDIVWRGSIGGYCVSGNCQVAELPMDVNGDGKIDLVRRWHHGAGVAYAEVYISDGTGFKVVSNAPVGGYCVSGDCQIAELPMDVNGDRKTDLVRRWHHDSGEAYAEVHLSNGTGFDLASNNSVGGYCASGYCQIAELPMDVDGDGKIDLVRRWRHHSGAAYAEVHLANGTGFDLASNNSVGGYCISGNCQIAELAMDVNGDGKTDLVRRWRNGTRAYAEIHLSNGRGFDVVSNKSVGGYCVTGDCQITELPMDVNGDGKGDLVRIWHGTTSNGVHTNRAFAEVWLSNGNEFTVASNEDVGEYCNVR